MLESLISYLLQFIDFFLPVTIVNQYERAVHLHFGKFLRTLEPGVWWKWPMVDSVHTDNVVASTYNLETQRLTTGDGVPIVISVALRWSIRDIKKLLLEVEHSDAVLADSTYGEVARSVRDSTWEEIQSDDWLSALHKTVRRRAFRFGVEVEELWLTDLVKTKVLTIVNSTKLP